MVKSTTIFRTHFRALFGNFKLVTIIKTNLKQNTIWKIVHHVQLIVLPLSEILQTQFLAI